ncbi:MAG TPA: hypothetical protein VJN39_12750 [Gemmatimonadales bacterium]|nr:hypothetical protein [Gemmatimonadales bacterium]
MDKLTFASAFVVAALGAAVHPPSSLPAAVETERIRARLTAVERELRETDVGALTPSQRAARTRNLDALHEYWVRRVFPKNTGFPGQRVPYFVDQYGTRCAMAYLIERSGHGDLVARVAATNNNARIRDLKTDPELVAWLQENGLTAAEAARIQPAYDGPPPTTADVSAASVGYKTTSGVAIGTGAVTLALNAARTGISPTLTGMLGIAGGAVGLAAGGPNLDKSGSRRTLGFVNTGVGAASVAFGVYRLASRPRTQARANVGPWVDARGAPGVSLSVTF